MFYGISHGTNPRSFLSFDYCLISSKHTEISNYVECLLPEWNQLLRQTAIPGLQRSHYHYLKAFFWIEYTLGMKPTSCHPSTWRSTITNMGRGAHRRNRRAIDEVDLPPRNLPFQRRGPSIYTPSSSPSAPPSPSVGSTSSHSTENPFQRCRQRPHQNRSNLRWQQSNKHPRYLLSEPQNRHVFLQKSLRLKQNLVCALTQALQQIEQWLPDEDCPDGDLMDWQPEDECLIPQPDNTMYTNGKEAIQRGGMSCARDRTVDFQRGYLSRERHRAANDAGVSRTLGCSSVEAQWCGTLRREPEPGSASPLSDDLGSDYGIA